MSHSKLPHICTNELDSRFLKLMTEEYDHSDHVTRMEWLLGKIRKRLDVSKTIDYHINLNEF
jgi:hypothetical protein